MPGKNSTLGGGGFHHVAIRARDFDKSVRFYIEGLGFTEKIAWGQKPGRAIMLDTGDSNYLEIFERPRQAPPTDEGVILHFAIRTTSVDAATAKARAAGAEITVEPKDVNIGVTNVPGPLPVRLSFFKGPDGEVIELFENDRT